MAMTLMSEVVSDKMQTGQLSKEFVTNVKQIDSNNINKHEHV